MGEWRRAENERLLRAQDELEDRVRERTADLDCQPQLAGVIGAFDATAG